MHGFAGADVSGACIDVYAYGWAQDRGLACIPGSEP